MLQIVRRGAALREASPRTRRGMRLGTWRDVPLDFALCALAVVAAAGLKAIGLIP